MTSSIISDGDCMAGGFWCLSGIEDNIHNDEKRKKTTTNICQILVRPYLIIPKAFLINFSVTQSPDSFEYQILSR